MIYYSKEIDELLRTDCSLYANLGLDSTKTEKEVLTYTEPLKLWIKN